MQYNCSPQRTVAVVLLLLMKRKVSTWRAHQDSNSEIDVVSPKTQPRRLARVFKVNHPKDDPLTWNARQGHN